MFNRYQVAAVCYAYLQDVEVTDIEGYKDLSPNLNLTSHQEGRDPANKICEEQAVDTRMDAPRAARPEQAHFLRQILQTNWILRRAFPSNQRDFRH